MKHDSEEDVVYLKKLIGDYNLIECLLDRKERESGNAGLC